MAHNRMFTSPAAPNKNRPGGRMTEKMLRAIEAAQAEAEAAEKARLKQAAEEEMANAAQA